MQNVMCKKYGFFTNPKNTRKPVGFEPCPDKVQNENKEQDEDKEKDQDVEQDEDKEQEEEQD